MNLSPRKEMVMNMFLVVIVKCMKLILHGYVTNLSAGRAGWLCSKSRMDEEKYVIFS